MSEDSLKEIGREECLKLMKRLVQEDGKLISPIDLSLDSVKPLHVDSLRWVGIDNTPKAMKLNNTGETVIVSAKWSDEHRPYLSGGPLDSAYVFSQLHFHWGADELEGSEHTIGGVRYPLEIHMVFFKSRYLTQDGALKYDDGLVIVVYLVKLQEKSTSGLQWLVTLLPKVTQPDASVMLDPIPLSALVVPFSKDYLMYCGALATHRCSHSVIWLISRSALAVSSQDLKTFTTLIGLNNESMTKTFREANSPMDRSLFHVSPSAYTGHLLLPGSVNPPREVNLTTMSSAGGPQDVHELSKGDALEDEVAKTGEHKFSTKQDEIETNKFKVSDESARKLHSRPSVDANRASGVCLSNKKPSNEVQGGRLQKRDNAVSRTFLQKKNKPIRVSTPIGGLTAVTLRRIQRRLETEQNN